MFKYVTVCFFFLAVSLGSVIDSPKSKLLNEEALKKEQEVKDTKEHGDLEKLVAVAIEYVNDPEVVNLHTLFESPEFKFLMDELVSLDEYKEVLALLESKGHNVQFLRDGSFIKSPLPVEEIKKLFDNSLETSPKTAKLFETINTEEFKKIFQKLWESPLFQQIKNILEGYGINFQNIKDKVCEFINSIYGGNVNGC